MNAPLLLELPWGDARLGGCTSTRIGGVSEGPYAGLNLGLNTADAAAKVLENRRRAHARAGWNPERTVYLHQVHGSEIREATAADAGRGAGSFEDALPACDASFTRVRGLVLAVGHADCLAVAVADPEAAVLGVAHAGWRGALAGLAGQLVRRLILEGARRERMRAVLSPCLGPSRLELGEEQFHLFQRADASATDYCSPLSSGHFHLDLWSCVRSQLLAEGLSNSAIHGQELDTAAHPELFFSHRRDAGVTGRMMTFAVLN
jgi:hypothetical protein